jgi:hypothetical protein
MRRAKTVRAAALVLLLAGACEESTIEDLCDRDCANRERCEPAFRTFYASVDDCAAQCVANFPDQGWFGGCRSAGIDYYNCCVNVPCGYASSQQCTNACPNEWEALDLCDAF